MFKKLQRLVVCWEIQSSNFSEVHDHEDLNLCNVIQDEMGNISEAVY